MIKKHKSKLPSYDCRILIGLALLLITATLQAGDCCDKETPKEKRDLYRINRYKPQDKISVNLLSYTILRYSNHHIVNVGGCSIGTYALDSYP